MIDSRLTAGTRVPILRERVPSPQKGPKQLVLCPQIHSPPCPLEADPRRPWAPSMTHGCSVGGQPVGAGKGWIFLRYHSLLRATFLAVAPVGGRGSLMTPAPTGLG